MIKIKAITQDSNKAEDYSTIQDSQLF